MGPRERLLNKIERESIGLYLRQKLWEIDVKLFALAKNYGVSDILEFDELVKRGKVHKERSFEDFFEFDNLEADRDKIIESLEEL